MSNEDLDQYNALRRSRSVPAHVERRTQPNIEAYCLALTKVYTFGPTFRAEKSNTSRHLAEFWIVEPEIASASRRGWSRNSRTRRLGIRAYGITARR
jgi:aspartyl/asparaginyl-tRNA synthetase